jgi:tetratricopeptide (TPR) repeat protein
VQASVLNNLGEMQSELGHPEAEKSLRAALAIFERLAKGVPASREDRHNLAIAQNNLGDNLVKLNRRLEAAPLFARSAANLEKLVAEVPKDIDLHSHFGIVLEGLGNLLLETGKPAEARKVMESAVAQQREALRLSKNRDSVRTLLGRHLIALAGIDLRLDAYEESAACAQELPKIVPASDRGQACLDAVRILAQSIAQIESNTKLSETERSRLTHNYLGRTIVLVGEAIDGSPARSEEIKKDPHIKALESRPEFRTMMNALQSVQR